MLAHSLVIMVIALCLVVFSRKRLISGDVRSARFASGSVLLLSLWMCGGALFSIYLLIAANRFEGIGYPLITLIMWSIFGVFGEYQFLRSTKKSQR